MKKITFLISIFSFMMGMSQNLITNGDFENGTAGWSGNAVNVVCQANNCYNNATINAAGNPWDVNLSYVLNIPTAGVSYQLTFKAWSNVNRPLIAGIGLNQDPWTNTTETVNLTSTPQTFTLNLTSNFSSTTSRIIFDMGNAVGQVNIDDVVLQLTPQSQLPLLLDFETASQFTFAGFEGLASATVVADPVSGGTNGNGFRLQNQTSGNPWQGGEVVLSGNKRVRLTTNKTMKVDVYSTQAFNLLLKVELGAAASATAASYTTPGQWQTLTFNFTVPMDGTGVANGDYQKIVFFGGWNATNNGFVAPSNFAYHVDNIRGEEGNVGPPPAPTVAAPTPPARPAADVISLFSDAYTNIPIDTWSASWDDSNIEDVTIQGNATKKILFTNFLGVILTTAVNATEMTHFHMDYWVQQPSLVGKVLNPKLSNHATGNGETNALLLTHLPTENGSWVSLDVPLSSFTPQATFDRQAIKEFLLTSNINVVYVDNIYLHKNTVLSVNEFDVNNKVTIYPNPANSVINLNAKHNIEQVAIFNITGQQILVTQPNVAETSIDVSNFNSGIYLVKTLVNGVENTTKFVKN